MHYKTTIALIIILGLVIGISVVYTTGRDSGPPDRVSVPRQFFYQVDDDEVEKVGVVYQGASSTARSRPAADSSASSLRSTFSPCRTRNTTRGLCSDVEGTVSGFGEQPTSVIAKSKMAIVDAVSVLIVLFRFL